MVWHRDSIGMLIQRFFFSLIIMSSMLTFCGCYNDGDTKECIIKTGVPLIFVLVFVTIKVSSFARIFLKIIFIFILQVVCLRKQQIFLWSGFVICLIAQFIVVSAVGDQILDDSVNKVDQLLMFLPSVTFGLAIDVQIMVSACTYKSIAFKDVPFKCARCLIMAVGALSLLVSIVTYTFCFLIFGGLSTEPELRFMLFVCFFVKAVLLSPFLGLEYYDIFFEHIYFDVQFQLNQIKTGSTA